MIEVAIHRQLSSENKLSYIAVLDCSYYYLGFESIMIQLFHELPCGNGMICTCLHCYPVC